jgi:hypothetical protein
MVNVDTEAQCYELAYNNFNFALPIAPFHSKSPCVTYDRARLCN